MKQLILTLLISNLLFANYTYQGDNGGKIDMHGGKKQKLIDRPSNLSSKPFIIGNFGLGNGLKKDDNKEKKTKEN